MSAAQLLHEYVLAKIDAEPLALRVKLYRALADLAATPIEAVKLNALANELEEIERKHQQLVLDFKRRAL